MTAGALAFCREQSIPGVEMGVFSESSHSFPMHTHSTYLIGIMEQGIEFCFKPGDDKGIVQAGDLALINPEQPHTGIPLPYSPSVSYSMFYLEQEFVRSICMDIAGYGGGTPEFSRYSVVDPIAIRCLTRAKRLLHHGGSPLAVESCLVAGLTQLFSRYSSISTGNSAGSRAGLEHRGVVLVKEFLQDLACEKVTLDQLAQVAGLSRYYLLRVFKKYTGITPHQFQTQVRIEQARKLLRQGLSIAQVAAHTGFTDQSHFTHAFKQITGTTPGRYQAVQQ